MVLPEVWAAAVQGRGMLCLGCLEARLRRPLTKADFLDCPLNQDPRERRSERLKTLLGDLVWSSARWATRPRSHSNKETT